MDLRWRLGVTRKVDIRLSEKEIQTPTAQGCPIDHLDDKVDSDQQVTNKELSLSPHLRRRLGFGTISAVAPDEVSTP